MFVRRVVCALLGMSGVLWGGLAAAHAGPIDPAQAVLQLTELPAWGPVADQSARFVGFTIDRSHAEAAVKDGEGRVRARDERPLPSELWTTLVARASGLALPATPFVPSAPPDGPKTMLKILQNDVEVARFDTTKSAAVAQGIKDIDTQVRALFDIRALQDKAK
ncbi:MAG: hypothetical protein ACRC20_16950 [Segniliparus sp.]|uniref:hypothetical protein n=1 Tax=Segniliparus sp. TaxID=2804064 RepID=UPI003F2DFCF1